MFEQTTRGLAGQNDPAQTAGKDLLEGDMSGPILVIDDEPYILRSLSYLLAREGYTVETASNGEEGLRRVRSLHPPLGFLGIMMPHMNRYQVSAQGKQDPALPGTHAILLSAHGPP